ncbi:MAG: hypothetical protein ABH821_01810 [archaeon]
MKGKPNRVHFVAHKHLPGEPHYKQATNYHRIVVEKSRGVPPGNGKINSNVASKLLAFTTKMTKKELKEFLMRQNISDRSNLKLLEQIKDGKVIVRFGEEARTLDVLEKLQGLNFEVDMNRNELFTRYHRKQYDPIGGQINRNFNQTRSDFLNNKLKQVKEAGSKYVTSLAKSIRTRDDMIIRIIKKEYNSIKKKPEEGVEVLYGKGHFALYKKLKNQGIPVSMQIMSEFDYFSRLVTRFYQNPKYIPKPLELERALTTRLLQEPLFDTLFPKVKKDTEREKQLMLFEKISNSLIKGLNKAQLEDILTTNKDYSVGLLLKFNDVPSNPKSADIRNYLERIKFAPTKTMTANEKTRIRKARKNFWRTRKVGMVGE